MATHKKNTLLQAATSHRKTKACKRVFFSATQEKILPTLLFLIKLFSPPHRLTANTTIFASNINRFERPVCGLQTVVLRTDSKPAGNIRLKEILKRRALFGNQTVVLLMNSCGNTNSGASNPFFLKLL